MPAARDMYSRAVWTLVFTLVMYVNSRTEFPGPSAVLAAILTLIALGFVAAGYGLKWIHGPGQARVLEQILDTAQLQGAERVLDVSDGPDLGIAAAKRLKSGKVISLGEPTANEASRERAKTEGVADKIRFESGDPGKLSYPDANFDVVISSRALAGADAAKAIKEMVRVLKTGGRLVIHEIGDLAAHERLLGESRLSEIVVISTTLPLRLGGHLISALK